MDLPHSTPLDPGIVAPVFEPAGNPDRNVAIVMRAVHIPVPAMADEHRVMPVAVPVSMIVPIGR